MKLFQKISIGFATIALSILGAMPAFAAGETLEVHVHKNSLSGDEWTSALAPIQVSITDQSGNGVGIGINGPEYPPDNGSFLLDPDAGPLESMNELTCSFSWEDETGTPVERVVELTEYDQQPAGQFRLPPERITEQRLLTPDVPLENCGGGEEEYNAFLVEIDDFPLNPFLTYREYISIPLPEDLLGEEITVSIAADPSDPDLDENDIDPAYDEKILGYVCALETTDEFGNPITKEGLCTQTLMLDPARAENGAFEVHLVVVSAEDAPVLRAEIDDPLVQGVNAEFSNAVTFVGNFLVRTTSLLDWTLAIDDTGLRNEKITSIYQRALNIVNGLFILSLLAIAFLWNFSILISKERLKRMIILFVIGIIAANFMLPLTRLLVDGTNLLQRTLLVKEESGTALDLVDGELSDEDSELAENLAEQMQTDRISASDILAAYDLDFGGFVGLQKSAYVDKNYPQDLGEPLEINRFASKSDLYVDRFAEHTWFNLVLIGLGAVGQLLIALILLFRHVILWFLLILSPFLLVLALFETTRVLFRYWIWLYARWLLIGPIVAMALFIIVNIWSLTGVPIESSYAAPAGLLFPNTTNLYIAAPGVTSGFLNTPREVMKYIAALMMLYMAVILPFWLTRSLPVGNSQWTKKLFSRKKGFLGLGKGDAQDSHQESAEDENGKKERQMLVHDAPSEVLSVQEKEQTSAESATRLDAGIGKLSEFSAEPEQSSTKDLVNTLNIILASNSLQQEPATKQARLNEQKEKLVQELQTRAEKGDAIAKQALVKAGLITADVSAALSAKAAAKEVGQAGGREGQAKSAESASASVSGSEKGMAANAEITAEQASEQSTTTTAPKDASASPATTSAAEKGVAANAEIKAEQASEQSTTTTAPKDASASPATTSAAEKVSNTISQEQESGQATGVPESPGSSESFESLGSSTADEKKKKVHKGHKLFGRKQAIDDVNKLSSTSSESEEVSVAKSSGAVSTAEAAASNLQSEAGSDVHMNVSQEGDMIQETVINELQEEHRTESEKDSESKESQKNDTDSERVSLRQQNKAKETEKDTKKAEVPSEKELDVESEIEKKKKREQIEKNSAPRKKQ